MKFDDLHPAVPPNLFTKREQVALHVLIALVSSDRNMYSSFERDVENAVNAADLFLEQLNKDI